jgi:ectoine hydroxylase-related dioxygenase (phytanoyl-CoA dioxygenase family)
MIQELVDEVTKVFENTKYEVNTFLHWYSEPQKAFGIHRDDQAHDPHPNKKAFGGVLYLAEMDGGILYYPESNTWMQPHKGDLVVQSSSVLHGADSVSGDNKRTVTFVVYDTTKPAEEMSQTWHMKYRDKTIRASKDWLESEIGKRWAIEFASWGILDSKDDEMKHESIAKDVILFKHTLENPEATQDFIMRSKSNGDKWFGDWQDWRPWGQYSKAYPYEDPSYLEDESEGAKHLKEFLKIFWDAMKIYKENYLNEDYFKLIGEDPNIPTSMEEARKHASYCSADVVILESENTDPEKPLSMEYHQDRRPWFGGTPHIFNFNIYTNDDYQGGDILLINTEDADLSTYTDANGVEQKCYMINPPVKYKMEAGDGLLFRTDLYHAVTPVVGNKFYVRQFLTASFKQEYIDKKASMSEPEFEEFLKEKEKEGFEKFGWQCRVYDSIDEAKTSSNDGVIVCVVKN